VIDRLTLAQAIEDAGIERAKAEHIAAAIYESVRSSVVDNVATKADVQTMQDNVMALRADMTNLQTDVSAIRAYMADTRALGNTLSMLAASVATVPAEVALARRRLLIRVGGVIVALIVVAAGALFMALHYWPPGHG
jgi:hypothetical protein